MNENRFVFVIPAYNCSNTIEQVLASIFYQFNHKNWLILIKDDMSTDGTLNEVELFCEKNGIIWKYHSDKEEGFYLESSGDFCANIDDTLEEPKVIFWENNEKKWEVKNVLEMIRSEYIKDNDIICRLDGDDFITDLCALQDINWVYENVKCDALWTANRWADQFWKSNSGNMPGSYMIHYSLDMGEDVRLMKVDGVKDVYKHSLKNWNTSHLKTFRKYLINNVNEENFKGQDGEYIKRCGDRAIYYPVLHKSIMPVFFPKQTYYYTIDDKPETYQTDDAKFQKEESDYITKRGFVAK